MTPSDTIEEILTRFILRYSQRIKHNNPKNQEAVTEATAQLNKLMVERVIEELESLLRVIKDYVSAVVYRDIVERINTLKASLEEGE